MRGAAPCSPEPPSVFLHEARRHPSRLRIRTPDGAEAVIETCRAEPQGFVLKLITPTGGRHPIEIPRDGEFRLGATALRRARTGRHTVAIIAPRGSKLDFLKGQPDVR